MLNTANSPLESFLNTICLDVLSCWLWLWFDMENFVFWFSRGFSGWSLQVNCHICSKCMPFTVLFIAHMKVSLWMNYRECMSFVYIYMLYWKCMFIVTHISMCLDSIYFSTLSCMVMQIHCFQHFPMNKTSFLFPLLFSSS